MSSDDYHLPDERDALRRTLLIWSGAFSALFVALFGNGAFTDPRAMMLEAFRYVVAMAIGRVVMRVGFRLRDVGSRRWWPAVMPLLAAAGVTMTAADFAFNVLIQPAPRPGMAELGWVLADKVLRPALFYVWVFGMALLILNLVLSRQRNQVQAAELAEARAAAAQAQLAMLRYQLNPHFLFNTLNAISSLVVTGRPAAAEEMLAKLSSFLRASLASDPGDFVTLDAELGMIQEYLDIEGVRFGERLEVDFACQAEAAPMLVPSLILQPLVENAIKYAVGPSRRPVTVKVDARLHGPDLVVMVSDDGEGAETDARGGTGVGLRNVRGRLQTIYGARGSLEAVPLERGFMAIVRLPAQRAPAHLPGNGPAASKLATRAVA